MGSLQELQAQIQGHEELLKAYDEYLTLDPTDQTTLDEKAAALTAIETFKAQIAQLEGNRPHDAAESPPPPPPPPPPPSELQSGVTVPATSQPHHSDGRKTVNHQRGSSEAVSVPIAHDAPVLFEVKDKVMAQWSEDKNWYPAVITGRTGPSTEPVYTVKFVDYSDAAPEQKRKYQVRPIRSDKKRKIDDGPAVSTPQPPVVASPKQPNHGAVISAAPAVDTSALLRKEPSKVSDGPTRMAPEPKKLKGSKTLDKHKNNWQNWSKTGPKTKSGAGAAGPTKKKDSMFRTPDLPNAKVGFTGSGKPMQKDQSRAKWNYGVGDAD